jgi:integrase
VAEVRRTDVARLVGSLHETPQLANQTIAVAGALFTWCEKAGLRPEGTSSPARGVERFRVRSCERFLSAAEYAALGDALARAEREQIIPASSIAAIRLLALSGMRRNEVRLLKWSEVQFERGVIELADSKTGAKTVPLNPAALELLSAIPRVAGNPYVFASSRGKKANGALNYHWVTLRELAGLPDVRMHDLRHSFASIGAAAGLGLPILGKLLGHASIATTQKYAHLNDDPVRLATNAIGGQIAAAMERRPSAEIVKLTK